MLSLYYVLHANFPQKMSNERVTMLQASIATSLVLAAGAACLIQVLGAYALPL